MKFAALLVKIFSGILSAFTFGMFLYSTYRYQLTQDSSNLLLANITLVIFLLSSLTFALLFITFDAYQNKGLGDELVKSILEKAGNISTNDKSNNTEALLQTITQTNIETTNSLNSSIGALNESISQISNSSAQNDGSYYETLNQLVNICAQISQNVENIGFTNEKNNDAKDGSLAVLTATVARLSSDLNQLNSRLIDSVDTISKNLANSINVHSKIDNDIKDIMLNIIKNQKDETSTMFENHPAILPDVAEDLPVLKEPEETKPLESVANFYDEHFEDVTKQQNSEEPIDIFTEEEFNPEPLDIFTEEAPTEETPLDIFTEEAPTEETPLDIFTEEAPQDLNLVEEEGYEEKAFNTNLNTIFNDDFANELADLDILKDNDNSVDELISDEDDPYKLPTQ